MNRVNAIKQIYDHHPGAMFVLSNGLTSRHAAHYLPQNQSLYLLHAMGEAFSVGCGIATARPTLDVVVIDGDGNALMGMAAWPSKIACSNIHYYILCNGTYETTGSQPLPPFPTVPDWANLIYFTDENTPTPNPPSPQQIIKNIHHFLSKKGS